MLKRIAHVAAFTFAFQFLLTANGSAQTTWYVPDDFPGGIQAALSSPSVTNWDEIIVKPGTYLENIDFLGKAVTVSSEQDATVTVIDGQQLGPVATFTNGEASTSVLSGFTLTNGLGKLTASGLSGGGVHIDAASPRLNDNIIKNSNAEMGGGISCHNFAAPEIIGCTVEGNEADEHGGGIYSADSASPLIKNNTIRSNRAGFKDNPGPSNYTGGGIYCFDSSARIIDNIIHGNEGADHGGGILCSERGNYPRIVGNEIFQNVATKGAGIYVCHLDTCLISENVVYENTSSLYGGGICLRDITCDVEKNEIYQNSAPSGGGICFDHASPSVVNNSISENTADDGGGIFSMNSTALLVNNTVFRNTSTITGGGIHCTEDSGLTFVNTILWNNSSPAGDEIWIGAADKPSTFSISYSNVEGGQDEVHVEAGCLLDWGEIMIDEDPMLTDIIGGDFHLTSTSPCINRGTISNAPIDDFDGNPRPCAGSVDMGADEFIYIHLLDADHFKVSETGGTVNFTLDAGFANGKRNYLLLGSLSGTAPGTPLPGDLVQLPLKWDVLTDLVLSLMNSPVFSDFMGKLDWTGESEAQLNVPSLPPGLVGMQMSFAYCLNNYFDFVSNPVVIEIVP
ncbi:MAG: NosD domain-containing protein [Planctomycetota bacterium]|jgi:parallel beta-helix repeat protein